jgi:peptidoglycan hydrolase-like protein with peptidoglycan-binding domain
VAIHHGTQTQDAVRLFQAAHGLVADGEVGDLTWRALGLD